MTNREFFFPHKNINISNLHNPFLIVNKEGKIIDSNERACEIFDLKSMPENFLLEKGGNKSFFLAFLNTIVENRYSDHTYFYPISVNDKSLKVFNTIYFIFSYLEKDLCLVKIRNIDVYNDLEKEYISIIKYGEALNKSSLALKKIDKNSSKKALSYIFKVSKASRVYIYKNFIDDKTGDLSTKCIEEICDTGIFSIKNNSGLSYIKYDDGLIRWRRELSEGRMLSGYVKNFPASELKYLAPQGTKYILIVPIITDYGWFGFLGFDFCYDNVKITVQDISSLSTLGKQLSNYYSLLKIEKLVLLANENMVKDLDFQNKMILVMNNFVKISLNEIIELSNKLNCSIENLSVGQITEYSRLIYKVASSVNNVVDYSSTMIDFLYNKKAYDLKPVYANKIINKSISFIKESALIDSLIINNQIEKDLILNTNENIFFLIFKVMLLYEINYTPYESSITIYSKEDFQNKGNVIFCIEKTVKRNSKLSYGQPYDMLNKLPKNLDWKNTVLLGIQISKRILYNINGFLSLKSFEGIGSSVYISIPRYKKTINIK